MRLVRDLRPRRILSIHSIAGDPCNNYDGPAEPLARAMASGNGYALKGQIGYPTPGSLGSWAGTDLGIPIVTLELPASTPGDVAWERNRSAILGFVSAR
jgi:protein MpaA